MSEIAEQETVARLPLDALHRELGAVMTEREGHLLPAAYGDPAAEYEAVRGGGAGLFDLTARGRAEVSGTEAVQFLNGLVTNDVKALRPGAWIKAAFPNAQGRLLAFARVMRPAEEHRFIIDTEAATHGRVLQTLERFTLAGDFKVKDLTGETAQLSVQGARAAEIVGRVLGDATLRIDRYAVADVTWADDVPVTVLRATHTAEDGYDLIAGVEHAADLWRALQAVGARPCGYEALEVLRVEAGVPRHGADAGEATVVPEAGQDDAVSYTKGCYIGQEIIARIHWRGHVAKRLAGLLFEGEHGAAPGAKIKTADGREIGHITSCVVSPRLGRAVALGYVKYDYLQPGTQVLVAEGETDGRVARVAELPLVRGGWQDGEAGA